MNAQAEKINTRTWTATCPTHLESIETDSEQAAHDLDTLDFCEACRACGGCGATQGEPCTPDCVNLAAERDQEQDRLAALVEGLVRDSLVEAHGQVDGTLILSLLDGAGIIVAARPW